jgi:hypothetical protein
VCALTQNIAEGLKEKLEEKHAVKKSKKGLRKYFINKTLENRKLLTVFSAELRYFQST